MLNKIYVVIGETGDYSDHTQWNIAAYLDKEQAEQHRDLANKFVENSPSWTYEQRHETRSPYDPNMYMDYTGTKYYVVEIPLIRHVDEFRDKFSF